MSAANRKPDINALQARLGHSFANLALLEEALTHVSANPADTLRRLNYQRLEFLGDRVLGLCVAEMLYLAFPDAEEGALSRRLADLVRKEACAEVAALWQLGPHLKLGAGEAHSGARKNKAILGDACEAVIGAVFLDGGFQAAYRLVEQAFGPRMRAASQPMRDAKTALQEWAQGLGAPPPSYTEKGRSGPDHAPRFIIAVTVNGHPPADGEGKAKRSAEQAAAEEFLRREGLWESVMGTGAST
ncbi:MAG: ribonuclease III [Bosea sp. (in: a-proteobacteria)]